MTATTIAPTDKSTLPQWEGHVVPWVARWTGEVNNDALTVSMHVQSQQLALSYKDAREIHDEFGILWKREGLGRTGEPEFAQYNTFRQRSCMHYRRCQVCGSKITDRVITWLMPKQALRFVDEGICITDSPPTCASCIPVAQELCPHLKDPQNSVILRVLEYRLWGVQGDGVLRDGNGNTQRVNGVIMEYGHPLPQFPTTAIAAKRQIVQLTKFTAQEPT